jgi:hypothetical protein
MRVHVLQSHGLCGIGVQFCVTAQHLSRDLINAYTGGFSALSICRPLVPAEMGHTLERNSTLVPGSNYSAAVDAAPKVNLTIFSTNRGYSGLLTNEIKPWK